MRAGLPQRCPLWSAARSHARNSLRVSTDAVHRSADPVRLRPGMAASSGDVFLARARCHSDSHAALRYQGPTGVCDGNARFDGPFDRAVKLQAGHARGAWNRGDAARVRDGRIVQYDQSCDGARTHRQRLLDRWSARPEMLRRTARARGSSRGRSSVSPKKYRRVRAFRRHVHRCQRRRLWRDHEGVRSSA